MDKIHVFNQFVSDDDCDLMVAEYNYMFDKFRKVADNRLLYHFNNDEFIKTFLHKYMPKLNKLLQAEYYPREVMLSIYKEGSFLNPHVDYINGDYWHNLGALFYFNDNFNGGELYFTKKDKSFKPQKGSVIVFPCNQKEYTHGVNEITSGIRYTMPVEISLNVSQSLKY